jgi:hypothetical protein
VVTLVGFARESELTALALLVALRVLIKLFFSTDITDSFLPSFIRQTKIFRACREPNLSAGFVGLGCAEKKESRTSLLHGRKALLVKKQPVRQKLTTQGLEIDPPSAGSG